MFVCSSPTEGARVPHFSRVLCARSGAFRRSGAEGVGGDAARTILICCGGAVKIHLARHLRLLILRKVREGQGSRHRDQKPEPPTRN